MSILYVSIGEKRKYALLTDGADLYLDIKDIAELVKLYAVSSEILLNL